MVEPWAVPIIETFVHFQKKEAKSRNVETSLYTDVSTFKNKMIKIKKCLYKMAKIERIFLIKMAEIGVSIIVNIPHCPTDKARAI